MCRLVLWLWCLLGVLAVLGMAAPSARADGAVTLVGGQLRFNSDSQAAENLVITRASDTLH